jgi:uncharacterized protein YbjT (DUF2867 family)
MALPGRERTASVGAGLDHAPPSPLYAEPSCPGRVRHQRGVIYSPSGDGKIPYIDPRDVAAVAFVTLTQPGHLGKKYVLTGSEAISYRQAAEIIGAVIGKKVRFVDESPEEARARRVREGVRPPSSKAFSLSVPISARAKKR